MVTRARVLLWGKTVGAIAWNEQGQRGEFQFDAAFSRSGLDVSPVMMPLSKARGGAEVFVFAGLGRETFKGLPGLLADSLPDRFGDQLLEAWLRDQKRDPGTSNPVERLCYLGHRGMGALEYEPSHAELEASSEALQVDELVGVARAVLQKREAFSTSRKKGELRGATGHHPCGHLGGWHTREGDRGLQRQDRRGAQRADRRSEGLFLLPDQVRWRFSR
jgi:serine/threonine-protein kinase HipA